MAFTPELIAELEMLALYNLDSAQRGLKVRHTAEAQTVTAAQRLYDKGLTDQPDGGYLTSLGLEAAEHVQHVLMILKG